MDRRCPRVAAVIRNGRAPPSSTFASPAPQQWYAPGTDSPALVKILFTPCLIALATLLARHFGPGIGGTIAGLPFTSTPVSVFLALEQGPAFAAAAAVGTLLGLLSQGALCLTYAWTARRFRWPTSLLAGLLAFGVATAVLARVSLPVPIALALVSGLLLLAGLAIPTGGGGDRPVRGPRWDLAVRMLAATAIVVVLTAGAERLGPTWTGLLSPFPVFALVLGIFTHLGHGSRAAARLLRGVVLGSLAHAAMFALVAALLPGHGLAWTYTWGGLAALAVNALVLWSTGSQVRAGRNRTIGA
ncbi:MAG TPA: hypothetical protein VMT79_15450 [Candidatus Binatia bacterium]|nr:hypothetical protein [Candidatus Binatia bacterium]